MHTIITRRNWATPSRAQSRPGPTILGLGFLGLPFWALHCVMLLVFLITRATGWAVRPSQCPILGLSAGLWYWAMGSQ